MSEKLAASWPSCAVTSRRCTGHGSCTWCSTGPQARGDAEPGSDIDVLVVLKGPVDAYEEIKRTSEFVADLSLRHGVVVSRVFMDEDRFTHRNGPLLRNIRREGIAI